MGGGVSERSVYDVAGGMPTFVALAAATHERCLQDEVLEHPFSHGVQPDHVERLGSYWAEVLGGPPTFSKQHGGHPAMLRIHAGQGMDSDLGDRFLRCFLAGCDDVELPDDPRLRATLRAYMEWACAEVMSYNVPDPEVDEALPMPRWSWDGLQS
jgi:hemoglobin